MTLAAQIADTLKTAGSSGVLLFSDGSSSRTNGVFSIASEQETIGDRDVTVTTASYVIPLIDGKGLAIGDKVQLDETWRVTAVYPDSFSLELRLRKDEDTQAA